MIDIHCHLLPGIDDGPDTLEQSLELAQFAVDHGITHSVVTPHIHAGRYSNSRQSIAQVVDNFKSALREKNINLNLGFAAEVRIGVEILPMIEAGEVPFLGTHKGLNVMLLEFPHSHIPPGSDKLVRWLINNKIRPLIAHPERNKGVMANFDKMEPFKDMGCLFQLTAGSIAGKFGDRAQECARHLLKNDSVTLIASDAHNIKHRPPRLDEGRDAAARIVGEELANAMVTTRPLAIVSNQFE